MIRYPVLIALGFIAIYVAFALGGSVICYTGLKLDPISRFRANEQLWDECKQDHLLFPLYYLVP